MDIQSTLDNPDYLKELSDTYYRYGWIKLKGLVQGAELKRIQEIVAEAQTMPQFRPKASGIQADQATADYERIMRVLRALWAHYPEVEALCRRVGGIVQQITGWSSTRLWSDRVLIKPGTDSGTDSGETIWHQDAKIPIDRREWATVWIALVDVPKTRGPMTFLNGSHRLGSLGAVAQLSKEPDLSELLTERDWDVIHGCGTAAPYAAGDASLHSMLTLHRATRNIDKQDRVAMAISYFSADALYTGAANPVTDGLGMTPYKPYEHKNFPIVA